MTEDHQNLNDVLPDSFSNFQWKPKGVSRIAVSRMDCQIPAQTRHLSIFTPTEDVIFWFLAGACLPFLTHWLHHLLAWWKFFFFVLMRPRRNEKNTPMNYQCVSKTIILTSNFGFWVFFFYQNINIALIFALWNIHYQQASTHRVKSTRNRLFQESFPRFYVKISLNFFKLYPHVLNRSLVLTHSIFTF